MPLSKATLNGPADSTRRTTHSASQAGKHITPPLGKGGLGGWGSNAPIPSVAAHLSSSGPATTHESGPQNARNISQTRRIDWRGWVALAWALWFGGQYCKMVAEQRGGKLAAWVQMVQSATPLKSHR